MNPREDAPMTTMTDNFAESFVRDGFTAVHIGISDVIAGSGLG